MFLTSSFQISSAPIKKVNNNNFYLISRLGGGVRRALIVVTMGPSIVLTTIVSPSLNVPFNSTTSIVKPKPSMAFTYYPSSIG
jgi:hypothetical protein